VGNSATRNAIRYLAQNFAKGIVTLLTYAYRAVILRHTSARTLAAAGAVALNSNRPRLSGIFLELHELMVGNRAASCL
jgi:hypothetical protein